MKTNNIFFEILAVDLLGKSVICSEKNLTYSLMGNGQLCKAPSLKNDKEFTDNNNFFSVKLITADEDVHEVLNKAFIIKVVGSYKDIEPIRTILVDYLKSQNFESIYILTDKVSEHIACELYPLVYEVENSLRHYLIKFMVTRLGLNWWNATATRDINEKIFKRKNNETVFDDKIDNRAYLIDFGELGQMIYTHSSGFTTKEDILKMVMGLQETPDSIKNLKEQLQSNYQKFFKESFKDKGFQEKWEGLEKLRHKIAHNSIFSAMDLQKGKEFAEDLIRIIKEADKSVENIRLDTQEKESIKESIKENYVSQGYTWDAISEKDFVQELVEFEERYSKQKSKFVSLTHFVKFHLGAKSYDYFKSYEIAESLQSKGIVEVYNVPNIKVGAPPVRAIKLLKIPVQ